MISFAALAQRPDAGTRLTATDAFTPPQATYPNGTHIAEVEIDPATGETRIVDYVVVDDFGATLNPLLLAGRVMPFDITFPDVFAKATRQNPAIHDGAIMVGRSSASEPYQIVGWSFRLFPNTAAVDPPPNRGSAFNSALAMSRVPTIDAAYWLSGKSIYRFHNGATFEVVR